MLDVVDDGPADLERTMDPFRFGRLERVLVRLLGPADHTGIEPFEGLFAFLGPLLGEIKARFNVVDVCGLLRIGRAGIQQAPLAANASPKDHSQ